MSFFLKKYMWVISLVAVIFCSYFLAKITANFVALKLSRSELSATRMPAPQKTESESVEKRTLDQFHAIAERNMFDSREIQVAEEKVPEPTEEAPINPNGEAVLTQLGIKLISTFSVGQGTDARSSAILSAGSGEDVYTVGDTKKFAPDTNIVKILFDRVVFTNKGRLEFVKLEDFAKNGVNLNVPPPSITNGGTTLPREETKEVKVEKTGEGNFVIDRAEIENAIANLDKLYTQVRAVPNFKDGKSNGLKLLSVRQGSIFSKLGLQRGDILLKINGVELDIKRGLEIFNQLKNESNLSMEIERRGANQTQQYEIR